MRRRVARLVAALLLIGAGSAVALEPDLPELVDEEAADYDVGNGGWNGLSMFAQLAAGDGFEVKAVTSIEWDDLESGDVLVLLYPINYLDPSNVNTFIRRGGHLILGDDFGQGDKPLHRLGMAREEGVGVGAARYHDDLPFAPIATPRDPDHPLARGVSELVTNHPAIISDASGYDVVFGFGDGEAVVVTGQLGAGSFVMLADPSVLINDMLAFPGNFEFGLNLLRYFAGPGERGRVVMLTGGFEMRGVPTKDFGDDSLKGTTAAKLREFNDWLDELNSYYLNAAAMRTLAIAAGLLLAALALLALPLRKGAALDGGWLRARRTFAGGAVIADFHAVLARYDDDRYRGSFLLPAAILRDTVEAKLARRLEAATPLALPAGELRALVEHRCGREARMLLDAVHERLRELPTRGQAESEWVGRFVARRDFERLHDDAQRLIRTLGSDKDA